MWNDYKYFVLEIKNSGFFLNWYANEKQTYTNYVCCFTRSNPAAWICWLSDDGSKTLCYLLPILRSWRPRCHWSEQFSKISLKWQRDNFMMTSSNGNIFRVTGHLCGEFPAQRPVTRSFDIFFDLRLNKRLSKQSWGWWFERLSCPLWRQCNVPPILYATSNYIHHKLWGEFTCPLLNFNGCAVEIWVLIIHVRIKIEPC